MLNRTFMLTAIAGLMATAPLHVRADDVADARKVVESFLTSVHSGDEKATHAAVSMTPDLAPAINAYLDLMVATSNLQKAAEAKFGSSAAPTFGKTAGPELDARLKAVREAPAKVAGNSVIVTLPADPAAKQDALTLVIIKAGAAWKIDGSSLFNLSPENKTDTEQRVALSGKLLAITRQMIQEINDGKYAAAVDAYQEFWTRSVKAAKEIRAPATSSPAPTQK